MADQQPDHAFYEQIQADHENLRELLGEVNKVFAGGQESATNVPEMLRTLATQLDTHFDTEEIAGVFDQVVERAPHLSERVDQLKLQHVALRDALAAVNQTANSGDTSPEWWNGLAKAFHDFSTDLMHHEAKENDLLQEAYTQDIGSKD